MRPSIALVHVLADAGGVSAAIGIALVWANQLRRSRGDPPLEAFPLGARCDLDESPLARATGMHYDGAVLTDDEGHAYEVPPVAQALTVLFDAGQIPEYDENKAQRRDA